MMKLVFFGTPMFAIPTLYSLHKSAHVISAVVTTPDKPSGRGLKNNVSPVKQKALELNYPIYQPDKLNDPDFLSIMDKIDSDLFIVVAYRILPNELISIPKKDVINLHASLLPKYRGAAPIHRAILNGERETGVTIFRINEKIDTGDILLQDTYKLSNNSTTGEIYNNLAEIGAKMMLKTLNRYDEIVPVEQDHSISTLAPKISAKECLIYWNKSAEIIHNQIRAFSPKPGAYTYFQNQRIKLYNSEINKDSTTIFSPGEIKYNNHCLQVGTETDIIHINEIQLEGKKRMPINQFIKGFPQIQGRYFG